MGRGLLGCVALVAALSGAVALAQPAGQRARPGRAEIPQGRPPVSSTFDNSARRVPDPSTPSAPIGLGSTTDPTICTQHGGFGAGLACKALLPQGRLVLVWDYRSGVTPAAGFHVYRVDGGARQRVDNLAITPDLTVFIVDPPPAEGYAGACYAVSAYGGGRESDLSPAFCAGGGSTVQTVTLSPTQWRSTGRGHHKDSHLGNEEFSYNTQPDGLAEAGFVYGTNKTAFGDVSDNVIYRLGILFDVNALANRRIQSAQLKMRVDNAWTQEWPWPDSKTGPTRGPPNDHSTSCIAQIGVGRAYWWNYQDWLDASVVSRNEYVGPNISIDVTSIVKGWASGEDNFGFVLMGEEENLNAFTEEACLTSYLGNQISLEVQYQ
jgi:hypothetical protein